jgi:glycosyltransferase involved in cell wall biosynthesis
MKILVVTNLYPTERNPTLGIFVNEQISSLRETYPHDLDIDVYFIEGSKSNYAYIKALFSLPRLIRRKKYDLIHVHYGLSLISLIFVFRPIVVTFHGSDLLRWPTKGISKLLKFKASSTIVVSKNLQKKLPSGIIIPCGINVDKFLLPSGYISKNFQEKAKNLQLKVLFPASPYRRIKNYPLFQKICEELESRGIRIKKIHLHNIPPHEVPAIFWESDIMILTSFSEGSPTVIKEAISAKLPFVSVDVGDVKEWVGKINFGVVTETRDPIKIADEVINLLKGLPAREKLNNTEALDKMDIKNIAHRIKALYDNVLTDSRTS